MPHLDTEVGRMLIQIEQRLQPILDRIRDGVEGGQNYFELSKQMAIAAKMKKIKEGLENALCG